MRKALWIIGLLVMVLGPAGPAAHAQDRHEDLLRQFSAYRSTLERWPIKRQAPATPLPLDLEKATNWAAAKSSVPGTAYDLLRRNAFVVFDQGRQDRVEKFYDSLKHQGLPLFITSDSVLHLYHVQFDETLASVEEDQFFNLLTTFSEKMADESLQRYREAFDQANPTSIRARITEEESRPLRRSVESLRRCTAYFWVAHKLLAHDAEPNAEVPDAVRDIVAQELALIEAHAGFAKSPIFTYDEDYSQYVPRGHYTRSDRLKKYFRAMMWFGRMTFLAKGRTEAMPDALVSDEEARIQTLAAFEIMEMLPAVKMKVPLPFPDEGNYRRRIRPTEDTTAQAVWERIYAVTAYYVGFADDLTPIEYRQALGTLAIEKSMGLSALVAHRWFELQKAIAGLRTPEIYSGLGNMEGPPPQIATEADLDKALAATQGMRLMGQRYVPDSYIMGRLVFPSVGPFEGRIAGALPFTAVESEGGTIRGFPRGLDVMAAFGSARGRAILAALNDDAYLRYDEMFKKLSEQFAAVSFADWNRDMYWSWLHTLRALLAVPGEGYPTFMRSEAWLDKQLNAALGSWSQLRHDTILYAKQSYTPPSGMPPPPKMVEGYVEPVPEFYARLLELTRMTRKGLREMKVLDPASDRRLEELDGILARLFVISQKELKNEKLTEDDYEFIRSFGQAAASAVAGAKDGGLETTLVADVHTDGNTGQVLEEGTGYLRTIAVAYPMPDGGTVIGFGPVFSYYEFKQPMSDRLTDEAWKDLLRNAKAPKLPEWVKSFSTTE